MKIVLASNNAGKLTEIKSLLSALDVDLVSQAELHVQEAEETGTTFVENALLKARHACVETGLPAIADDSGLQVTALGGEPGVYSARYSGGDSMDNINKLLENLRDLTGNARRASFHCAMVFLAHEHDPTPLICQGAWNGYILEEPEGDGGFGYDPVFYVPESKCSAANLTAAQKNQLSHRGKALSQLLEQLPKKWQR